ncbi:MAG: hypothetical protein NT061_12480 [Spirochaetes bacterium]|nr:hypothetical protein [Spirochaetota bacterium]
MVEDQRIAALIDELQAWPGPSIASHRSAAQFFHKLVFIADSGVRRDDPGVGAIVRRILSSMDEDGVPSLPLDIGAAHGGPIDAAFTGAWALCDAPNVLYALKKLGVEDPRIDKAVKFLARLPHADGYGCAVSKSLGAWRGPGKKSDPCPYATLIMLRLLLAYGDKFAAEIRGCAECLLGLWERSHEKHPYIFYMGTDFRKLKLPFIWYDILHVTDVLSRVESIRGDKRLIEMFTVIEGKRTAAGFIPESVYQAWKDWDFGQKKIVSPTMTDLVNRIEERFKRP